MLCYPVELHRQVGQTSVVIAYQLWRFESQLVANLVELRGIEPLRPACKAGIIAVRS